MSYNFKISNRIVDTFRYFKIYCKYDTIFYRIPDMLRYLWILDAREAPSRVCSGSSAGHDRLLCCCPGLDGK